MVGQILELTRTGLAVHKRRGFLAVDECGAEAGRIGLEDIEVVLASSPGLMWSHTVLAELAARQVPVMVLGPSFTPVSVVLPLVGHHAQAARFRAQAEATLPLLMGKEFRRDRDAVGANAMLNYGYAVLRAATARAIVASGLHPSLSLHHRSGGDALALADDLMEPFRPKVDLVVHRLLASGTTEVTDARADLVACLSADFPTKNGATRAVPCAGASRAKFGPLFPGPQAPARFPVSPTTRRDRRAGQCLNATSNCRGIISCGFGFFSIFLSAPRRSASALRCFATTCWTSALRWCSFLSIFATLGAEKRRNHTRGKWVNASRRPEMSRFCSSPTNNMPRVRSFGGIAKLLAADSASLAEAGSRHHFCGVAGP